MEETIRMQDTLTAPLYDAWCQGWISTEFADYLVNEGFLKNPASLKWHGAHEGGLYMHSLNVYEALAKMTKDMDLKWDNPRSPFIVGMFHDLCKLDNYKFVPTEEVDGFPYEWNNDQLLSGHGDKSVMMLSRFMQLTEEEMLCIRYHMGAYNKDDWDGFDRAIKKYPNVLWAHTADMYASKVVEK